MNRHVVLELVTPTTIGGANAGKWDHPPTLRPPSLRGHLRFWSRALGGQDLEKSLWGQHLGDGVVTPDTQQGQRTRIVHAVAGKSWRQPVLEMSSGIPSEPVCLTFFIPREIELEPLRAVLWTWLHLGSIGRRSRRGHGSVQWLPSKDDLFDGTDWPQLWPSRHLKSLENPKALQEHLYRGLEKVGGVLGRPGKQDREASQVEALSTLDQVFIGKECQDLSSVQRGTNRRAGPHPELLQLGHARNPPLPSPMMWRCFRRYNGNTFIPVMTWFPHGYKNGTNPKLDPEGGVYSYLHRELGFESSLTGKGLAR